MAEQIDSQAQYDDESDSLRKTLELMRREAEEEVIRLNNRLAERDYAPDSSIATATERLAMQQEMMMLQQTLEAKEQALDHITEECRRLEDELEDQNIAYDSLKQEIERKEQALKDAHGEVERLRGELVDAKRISERRPVAAPAEPVSEASEKPKTPRHLLIAGGVVLFVLLSLAMVALLYSMWDKLDLSLPNLQPRAELPPDPGLSTASRRPIASVVDPRDQVFEVPGEQAQRSPAVPPRIYRDRLSGGSQGPAMIALEGSTFQMGYNSLAGQDFSPEHGVRVSSFMIGAHEVTFQEYDRFAQATGRALPDDYGWGRGTRPVVGVSWDDARAYAAWLSQQTRRRYRLPTEAEWEFVARAGSEGPFWWGYELEPGRAVCFDCGSQWDNRSTAPVESFAPNPFGLYDTAGNAMEWVADCYVAGYEGAPKDGSARLGGECRTRVARGGAFNKPASSMRSYVRARFDPQAQLNMLGFRVARDS
ncbi:SUMF1/EgtB/PvdO family nonheme iron enzyme [Thiorhodococcus mannitoliphagus]|uniref:SUMF1/EgtB/PvdO family nonheme iron enzyme n=1 Tax=Thiorhodococcus mannitoliphagus TaxID=329406 RepID=A0A6P1E1B2_9GAMM|nr:formylglycine-generating enzyme family protein [Thiorhodococcus mannitoliphagus]NEX22836.1 SUMF1/EgtB/PvdO family nonheme iron enzyme [Thiorhodococcus mannitoliphagus]